MEAAKCFRCIPRGEMGSVMIYLYCQWLKKKVGPEPVGPFIFEPDGSMDLFEDAYGVQTGTFSLADFNTLADIPSVVAISFSTATKVTLLQNLSALPILASITGYNSHCTTVDVSGCHLLTRLQSIGSFPDQNWTQSIFGLLDCPILDRISYLYSQITSLDISHNPLLTYVNLSNCLLTQASVDSILSALVAHGLSGGTCQLHGTGRNSAPSASGLIDKATLVSRSWSVTTVP